MLFFMIIAFLALSCNSIQFSLVQNITMPNSCYFKLSSDSLWLAESCDSGGFSFTYIYSWNGSAFNKLSYTLPAAFNIDFFEFMICTTCGATYNGSYFVLVESDPRFLRVYLITTASATQIYFGNFSTFGQIQIAASRKNKMVAVVKVPNTGTTVTLMHLLCSRGTCQVYGSSFSINIGATGTLKGTSMSDSGLYSTYAYYTTTSVVYKTYNNTGTGYTALYSKTATAFFNFNFITSADGLKFICLDRTGTNQSIKIYYLANSSLQATVTPSVAYPSSNGAALYAT